MDRGRFDELARLLAAKQSRRATLAALFGSLLMPSDPQSVEAGHENRRKHRQRKRRCQHGACANRCINLDQLCSIFDGPKCCSPTSCRATAGPFVTTCQTSCSSDQDCYNKLSTHDVHCVDDAIACQIGSECCRPKVCTGRQDCPSKGLCCRNPNSFSGICCLEGQKCTPGVGCQDT